MQTTCCSMTMMMTATPSIAVSKIGHPFKLPGGWGGGSSSRTLKFLLRPQNTKAHPTHTHTHTNRHAHTRTHTHPNKQTQTQRKKCRHTRIPHTRLVFSEVKVVHSIPRQCVGKDVRISRFLLHFLHGDSRFACSRILSSHLANFLRLSEPQY